MRASMGVIAGSCVAAALLAPGCDSNGTKGGDDKKEAAAMLEAQPETQPYVLDHAMKRIDGTEESLETYRGKVVMVVNVASKCGLTPQYAQLEELYEARKGRGFVILGFPANDFNEQEPGTNGEIAAFCTANFGVTFPMFEKITVKGEEKHPLYEQLSKQGGEPTWNFTKYLVDRRGHVVARFDPRTTPDDPALLARLDELLAQSAAD
ncbi:MAG: glutathione peroxidase [Phycisphaerales bacterium]|nr:glutathione peroxidase [Phycisphaerales bacterium]